MKILSISLDRRVLGPSTVVAQRQADYFKDHEVTYLVLDDPKRSKVIIFLSAIFQACRAKGFDLVTTQDPLFSGVIGYLAARRSRAGLQIQDHSGAFGRSAFSWKERLLRPISKYILKRADRVRTVSLRGKNGLIGIGVAENRIDVVPIATDVSRFKFHTSRTGNEIVCVSRLEKEKGVEILLAAFDRLKSSHPELILTVVGDGSLRTTLDVGKKDVNFVGNQTDVRPYLDRATVYVQPSYFEGWGMAVVEAAASGAPIVMTDVGLAGEVICDEESGLVTPVGDPEALAKAIERVLGDRALGARLAANARSVVEKLPDPNHAIASVRESMNEARRSPRLLIMIQAVDLDDPLMGFFYQWLEEASPLYESITVFALRVGRYDLPKNIRVIPSRPSGSKSRARVLWNIWKYSVVSRAEYDAVFVRGDAQYILGVGLLWRLLGKKTIFWYAHYRVSVAALVASWIASVTVTSVREAFDHPWAHPLEIGQGIDAKRFASVKRKERADGPVRMLGFGRVMESKRIEDMISAFIESGAEKLATFEITGPRPDAAYFERLHAQIDGHPSITWGEDRVSYDRVPEYLSGFDVLLNAYPASLDKTIIESMMVGIIPLVATRGILHGLPEEYRWIVVREQEERVAAIRRVFMMGVEERRVMQGSLRIFALTTHSVSNQVERIRSLVT